MHGGYKNKVPSDPLYNHLWNSPYTVQIMFDFRRSISDIADQNFDDIMDEISTKFQRLDASMGSVNSSYLNA